MSVQPPPKKNAKRKTRTRKTTERKRHTIIAGGNNKRVTQTHRLSLLGGALSREGGLSAAPALPPGRRAPCWLREARWRRRGAAAKAPPRAGASTSFCSTWSTSGGREGVRKRGGGALLPAPAVLPPPRGRSPGRACFTPPRDQWRRGGTTTPSRREGGRRPEGIEGKLKTRGPTGGRKEAGRRKGQGGAPRVVGLAAFGGA